ncbi:MAG: response regulator [Nitrospirae bacterium]|nr:response regulator [Nitrospirota bacterium]
MKKKILIVDDLRPFIEQEKNILSRADFQLFTASSGREALEIHKTEKVDIIIADLDMPEVPGDELSRAIREDKTLKKVSIIIVCTKKASDIERCARCGANTYITRPLKGEELLEKVHNLLDVPLRKDIRVLIKVAIKGRFGSEPFFCTSQDISKSGILIETDKTLAKGDIVICSFFMPYEERIVADCEVVRVMKTGSSLYCYGARFINLNPEYESVIERYVKKQGSVNHFV